MVVLLKERFLPVASQELCAHSRPFLPVAMVLALLDTIAEEKYHDLGVVPGIGRVIP